MLFLAAMLSSVSAFAIETEFSGYLRGGSGLNFEGGQQECFVNQGIPGNFIRLGNECGFYSELGMAFHHQKATATDPFFFQTLVRLVISQRGTRQYEPQSTSRDISQIEAYTKAGGFDEVPGEYWIGKRFYRELDLNIFDWYYYADMSGVGAGVENIKIGSGKFSFAHLIQANDTVTTTSVGRPVLNALDFRYREVPVSAHQAIHFWGAYAWAPASHTATADYTATKGFAIGTRLHSKPDVAENEFSLMFGQGAMKDLTINGDSAVPTNTDQQNKAWTVRLVNDWHRDVTDRWGIYVGVAAEEGNNGGAATGGHRGWQEAGVRPIYYVTDRFQLMFEGGYSHFKDEGEVSGGVPVGDRELGRLTFAPQLSIKKGIWGRPVMRAFVTHSIWNRGNQASIGVNAPTFMDKTEGTAFGYQFETWF